MADHFLPISFQLEINVPYTKAAKSRRPHWNMAKDSARREIMQNSFKWSHNSNMNNLHWKNQRGNNVAACFETGGSKIEHSGINVLCNRFIIGWETIAIWHAWGIVFKTMDKLSNLFFSQSKIAKIGKNIQPSTVAFILAGDLTVNLYT